MLLLLFQVEFSMQYFVLKHTQSVFFLQDVIIVINYTLLK
jgi:hypothetical protein